jgi:CRP-like cAMP-binding protein
MAVENRILAALTDGERENIVPHLERPSLPAGRILFEPGDPVRHIYFPTNSIISMLSAMENGATVEAGLVGKEGVVGISAILGAETSATQALVQVAGEALCIPADVLMTEFKRAGMLQALLLRHTHTLFTMVSQTAACNRLHNVEERLARWLLTTNDRVESDEFLLTQEFIARMLGTRRSGVTVAAGILQQAGLINYKRGRIKILDREGLEEVSCECYRIVKKEYERYLKAGPTAH